MKKILKAAGKISTVLFFFCSLAASAQTGYEIKVTLRPLKNSFVYLGHYYGKQLPIIDSARLNEKSEAIFKGSKKLGGGIYLIGFPDKTRNFEILVDKNQHFTVLADTADLQKVQFINSPDNTQFKAYQAFMSRNGRQLDELIKMRSGKSAKDSLEITRKIEEINTAIKNYRADIMRSQPNSLLSTLLKAMKEPEIPKNNVRKDSLFAYHYFKKHYWDDVNFYDDRLARTPFFESRIDKYFEQLVYPSADSVNKEMDWMLGYASINEEMQKFLLLKFVNRYLNQKFMWEDAVYVHLFEKYFSQNNYSWLTDKGKKIISDRAYSLMSNIMGTPAAEIVLPDSSGNNKNLYGIDAAYVLLAIYDPTCSHCKEIVPRLDSMYQAKWKRMGMKIYGLAKETEGSRQDWMSFIQRNQLKDWINVYDSKAQEQARVSANIPSYGQLYDVQTFPTLYLLDKDKRIIAKKLSYDQIDEILQHKIKNQ